MASLIAPKSSLGSFSRPNKEFLLLQHKNSKVLNKLRIYDMKNVEKQQQPTERPKKLLLPPIVNPTHRLSPF